MATPTPTRTAVPAALARAGVASNTPVCAEAIRAVGSEHVSAVYFQMSTTDMGQAMTMYAVTPRALVRFERALTAALTTTIPLTQVLNVAEREHFEPVHEVAVTIEVNGLDGGQFTESEGQSREGDEGDWLTIGRQQTRVQAARFVLTATADPALSQLKAFAGELRAALT